MEKIDYTDRIRQLKVLRGKLLNRHISTSPIHQLETTVPGWQGESVNGFYDLVEETKKLVDEVYSSKEKIIEEINNRITQLEIKIENQYSSYKYIAFSTYDLDYTKNRNIRKAKVNQLTSLDSTVRRKILNQIKG